MCVSNYRAVLVEVCWLAAFIATDPQARNQEPVEISDHYLRKFSLLNFKISFHNIKSYFLSEILCTEM